MRLFFDTETTGLGPDAVPVQLAWVMEDASGRVVRAAAQLIALDGWEGERPRIDPDAARVHGITPELLARYGRPPELVLMEFRAALATCDLVLAHNIEFDQRLMTQMCAKQQRPQLAWPETFCTCLESTAVCQIPSPRGYGFKWPKLGEAYRYFTGQELRGAHDALVDVYGCRTVYRGLMKHRASSVENISPVPEKPITSDSVAG